MEFGSINEIFEKNDRVHAELQVLLAGVTDDTAGILFEGEKWTIAQLVEHIATVDEGASKICNKLLSQARDAEMPASGPVAVSNEFQTRSADLGQRKVEATERVRPTGNFSIAESLARMDQNRLKLREIQPLFETYDGNEAKFPHPFLGEMSAIEWLIMKGGHEARHTRQIEKILKKLAE
ncbi:MAG TPA: DinB family protein [Pyrinomonadaceae bacterium]